MVLPKLLKSKKRDKDKEKEKKRLKKIEKILLDKKEKIEKELEKLADLDEQKLLPDFGDSGDEEIYADEIEEIGNSLAVRNVLEKELENIVEALEKIKKGKYGICENCAKPIKLKKIKIKPSSKYCVKCIKEMEKR